MTQIVGILNLTPDSFSEDGTAGKIDRTLELVSDMIAAGVGVLDIGAESTRPGATPIPAVEEWQRLQPALEQLIPLAHAAGVKISIDTRHAATARHALALGADWINDVSGFSSPEMIAAVKDSDCTLVCMHSLTVPADPSVTLPGEADIIHALRDFANTRIAQLVAAGIDRPRIIFDPGIGFNKTAAQSLDILRRIDELNEPMPLTNTPPPLAESNLIPPPLAGGARGGVPPPLNIPRMRGTPLPTSPRKRGEG